MKIRERLVRRKHYYAYWGILSVVVAVVLGMVGQMTGQDGYGMVALLAVASYVVSIFFYRHGVRCPRCKGNIGGHTNYFGLRRTWFFRPVNYCPFCGVQLDEPVQVSKSA